MTPKDDPEHEPTTTAAAVNWEGIARFLGQSIEDVDRVRRMELEPAVSSSTVAPKR